MSDTKQIAEWLLAFDDQCSATSSRLIMYVESMTPLYESAQRDKQRITELEAALKGALDMLESYPPRFGVCYCHTTAPRPSYAPVHALHKVLKGETK